MLETGTHPCQWTYRDQAVTGEMRLEGSQKPVGEMLGAPGTWVEGRYSKHTDTVDVLRGRVRSGHDVALLNVHLKHWAPERARVRAGMALIGWDLPKDSLFNSVEFQVGGLTELAGVYPRKSINVDLPKDMATDVVYSVTWNAETATQTWTNDDGDKLALEFTPNMSENPYSFSLTSAPVVTVSGTPRSPEKWMLQYVRPLAEIATLATLRPQPVSWVTLHHGGQKLSAQLFAADIAQQPYDAAPTEISELISHDSGTLICLGPDGATLPDLLAGWQRLRTTYITFFAYLTAALRDSMSTKSRFLTLVPALEGFHVAKSPDDPMPQKEYQKQRKGVLERIAALEPDPEDIDFIKTWLKPSCSYRLDHRLREIFERELSEGLRERIRARVEPVPEVLRGLSDSPKDAWEVMANARNRIAHGAGKQPSPAQVAALTHLAHPVAIGIALNHLGVPDTLLCPGDRPG